MKWKKKHVKSPGKPNGIHESWIKRAWRVSYPTGKSTKSNNWKWGRAVCLNDTWMCSIVLKRSYKSKGIEKSPFH